MSNYKKARRQISRLRVHIFLLRSDKRTCINVPANSICNKCYRGFIMLIGRSTWITWRRFAQDHVTPICNIYVSRFVVSIASVQHS